MTPSLEKLNPLLELAQSTLDEVREYLLKKAREPLEVNIKADQTFVSEADLATEKLIRDRILKQYPNHGILGEEFPPVNPESDWKWLIDPIDGTQDFIMGIPLYGSILALQYKNETVLGLIDAPESRDRYHAIKNGGSYWNNKRIQIGDLDPRAPLILSNYSCFLTPEDKSSFHSLFEEERRILIYPNCSGHGLVARGAAAAMVDFDLNLWDIAATQLIIEEAGGQFEVQKTDKMYNIILGNPHLVDKIKANFNRFTNLK